MVHPTSQKTNPPLFHTKPSADAK